MPTPQTMSGRELAYSIPHRADDTCLHCQLHRFLNRLDALEQEMNGSQERGWYWAERLRAQVSG